MKILIAEDDRSSRKILAKILMDWGYQVTAVEDGESALIELQKEPLPDIAILDWMMPKMDGIDVCKTIRNQGLRSYIYMILLTAKDSKSDISIGLEAGADDYIVKPFDRTELHSRVKVGERMIHLERQLEQKISELEDALSQVKQLKGFLPICANCKKIRNDDGYWQAVEGYIHQHTEAVFSHGICPDCAEELYPGMDLEDE